MNILQNCYNYLMTKQYRWATLLHCSAQLARSCSDCGVVYRDRSVITIILANGISWSRRWALCRTRVIIRSLIGYCNSPAVSIFSTPFIPELTRKYFNKINTLWIRIFYTMLVWCWASVADCKPALKNLSRTYSVCWDYKLNITCHKYNLIITVI